MNHIYRKDDMQYPEFVKFFNNAGMTFNSFSKMAKVDRLTVKKLYEGKTQHLQHITASRIVAASGGKLKLSDFGFVD